MRILAYSCQSWERPFLEEANRALGHELSLLETRLCEATTSLARGFRAVAIFAHDDAQKGVLERLRAAGVELLCLRSAGYNHVDVAAADALGLMVLRVPAYSPHAIAEHTVGLMLALNRKLHRAYNRVREQNFSLDGLLGFDLHGKTVGVIGTGKIGLEVCRILAGFGCRLLATDPQPSQAARTLGVSYVELPELLEQARIITLHCPLTPATRHLIDAAALARTQPGLMLINTSRGAVIDSRALIAALKAKHLGAVGLDVYEEEADLFFHDLSNEVIQDDVFVRLLTFPNVLITAHQAFFTREAVSAIASTTLNNASDYEHGHIRQSHRVSSAPIHYSPA